ncbi:hypothetical protein [Enterococcus thailandicus]|uniref:hypothetical protein n=1 Tax=Enterococcus thailandicus TaxID=417368 RepID=UPI0022E08D0B|nr:hypothetical protein [Enterococcus thailandicus]
MSKKVFVLFSVLLVLLSVVVPISVSAQTIEKNQLSKVELSGSMNFQKGIKKSKMVFANLSNQQKKAEIDKVASELEFMFTQALLTNEQGEIVGIDYAKLEEKYGTKLTSSQGYSEIKDFSLVRQNNLVRGTFLDCMSSSIKDFIGATLWSAIISAGVMGFIKQMAWREVAALIVEFAGAEFTVIALVGTLSWMAINCA